MDRLVLLAQGLAGGLLLEQAAREAGFSLSTAIAVSSSDAFKDLLAGQKMAIAPPTAPADP